jgi:hypothetical protein
MDWFFCGARPSPARSNIQITTRFDLFATSWPDLVAAPEDGRDSERAGDGSPYRREASCSETDQ